MKKIKKPRKYRLDKHTKKVIKIGVITLVGCFLVSITFRTISSFILYNIENTKSIISLKEEVETLNTYNSMLFKEAGLLHNRVLTLENEIKELKDK